ncbi:MAG: hypothetical protein D3904_18030, partial [Candidatus Electrothrix sp. EH2]|nr:hypothetical protein [Candidatus Electrothrix sp. EH2]
MKNWKITAGAAFCAVLTLSSIASAGVGKANKIKKQRNQPQPVENQILVSFKQSASAPAMAALHSKAMGKVIKKISRIGVEVIEVPEGTVADAVKAYKKNPNVAFAEPNYRRVLITSE